MSAAPRPTVLVVEDEPKLAGVLADYLAAAGYASEIVGDGRRVADRVRATAPALVLLDIMLPGKDGLEVCREIRGFSDVPIVMVTARIEEIDRIVGLELGADDYICKPFSPREVVARVKAILRRASRGDSGAVEGLVLDAEAYSATLDGKSLPLTPVEFRLLHALAERPGRVLSRAQLLDRLYDDRRVVSDRTVDSHVKNLRQKLAGIAPEREFIESLYGVGYRLRR